MKASSQTQNTNTHPINLTNSILQALSGSDEDEDEDEDEDSSVLPIIMPNTSPHQSEALQRRKRLRRILDSAIALIDEDDFDPIESSTTYQ
jgi:hypothetical protein